MTLTDDNRRNFLAAFTGMGLGGTLLPGVLWAQVQQSGEQRITQPMLADALALSGLTFTDEEQKAMLQAVNQNLTRYRRGPRSPHSQRRRAALLLQRATFPA